MRHHLLATHARVGRRAGRTRAVLLQGEGSGHTEAQGMGCPGFLHGNEKGNLLSSVEILQDDCNTFVGSPQTTVLVVSEKKEWDDYSSRMRSAVKYGVPIVPLSFLQACEKGGELVLSDITNYALPNKPPATTSSQVTSFP